MAYNRHYRVSAGIEPYFFLHLGIGPQGRLATLTNAMGWAARFGLTHDKVRATIDSVWRVVREWKNRFEEYGVPAAQIDKVSSAFRHAREISGPGPWNVFRLIPRRDSLIEALVG